jgi:hypothetical protein
VRLIMGNLARYRLFAGLFAAIILLGVSNLVGDGDRPGTIDVATKLIVTRLNSNSASQSAAAPTPQIAVSQTETAHKWWAASPGSPTDVADSPDVDEQPDAAPPDLPPPDDSMIHK